ncbi:TPA: hypothetical protein N3288_000230 [Klebsiella aerogenes]|nr:hypothetical protein [Klebsiella aerogenes]
MKNNILLAIVAVIALFSAYRYGVNTGSDWRDEYHLTNDLSGEVLYRCESQIADNPLHRDIYVNFGKQRVFYSNDHDFTYDSHKTFVGDGATTVDVLGKGYYAEFMLMTNGITRIFIEKGDHVIDSLYCTGEKR